MKTRRLEKNPGHRKLVMLAAFLFAALTNAQPINRLEPLPGVTTSGQPDRATLEQIAEAGYAAVIDLKGPEENRDYDEADAVARLGMRYVSLPVAGIDDISYANAGALDEILKGIDGPVLVHCSSGNRAGALLALRARLAGAGVDDALALGEAGGITRADLRDAVEQKLREHE